MITVVLLWRLSKVENVTVPSSMWKQGKSWSKHQPRCRNPSKNVVNPDDVVEQYGADTLRVYEMFMGPLDASIAWSEEGLEGSRKFLDRVYRLITSKEIVAETMVL